MFYFQISKLTSNKALTIMAFTKDIYWVSMNLFNIFYNLCNNLIYYELSFIEQNLSFIEQKRKKLLKNVLVHRP